MNMDKIDGFRDQYRFLSNFYPCVVEVNGIVYPTAEHAYQAAKSPNHNDRLAISKLPKPGDAKRYGRVISIRSDWGQVKYATMLFILWQKFKNEPFKSLLVNTCPLQLIEGNTWHDNIWGDCSCPRCRNITGQDLLGKALMDIRDRLGNESRQQLPLVLDGLL